MGEVVNLRMARKRRKREDDARTAEANRVLHGRSKSETIKAGAENLRQQRALDGHRLDEPDGK